MVAGYVPRRNWEILEALGTENTLTTVPLSLAVASSVPSLLKLTATTGDLCACTIFTFCSESASNTKMFPVPFRCGAAVVGYDRPDTDGE